MDLVLDFERPIVELRRRIEQLRSLQDDNDMNLAASIEQLELQHDTQVARIFSRLTSWQRTQLARHPARPYTLDYVAGLMGARKAGASRQALIGAALGTVVGLFMGLVGVLFMPLVGAAVGEYLARRDQQRALKVGVATWLGIMAGLVSKVVIAFMMIGVFVVALIF